MHHIIRQDPVAHVPSFGCCRHRYCRPDEVVYSGICHWYACYSEGAVNSNIANSKRWCTTVCVVSTRAARRHHHLKERNGRGGTWERRPSGKLRQLRGLPTEAFASQWCYWSTKCRSAWCSHSFCEPRSTASQRRSLRPKGSNVYTSG